MNKNRIFKVGSKVVYPSHGVGTLISIDLINIADSEIEVYVIFFEIDKMTLQVPIYRSDQVGLRNLVKKKEVDKAYEILQEKPKKGNKMWSRRAQEYETKINSGDFIAIAEVIRDLYKNVSNDRSFSERSIYELALSRLVTEIAALENTPVSVVQERLIEMLKAKLVAA